MMTNEELRAAGYHVCDECGASVDSHSDHPIPHRAHCSQSDYNPTEDRLDATEGRLADIERRLAELEKRREPGSHE